MNKDKLKEIGILVAKATLAVGATVIADVGTEDLAKSVKLLVQKNVETKEK